jgi:hypothetical protein
VFAPFGSVPNHLAPIASIKRDMRIITWMLAASIVLNPVILGRLLVR